MCLGITVVLIADRNHTDFEFFRRIASAVSFLGTGTAGKRKTQTECKQQDNQFFHFLSLSFEKNKKPSETEITKKAHLSKKQQGDRLMDPFCNPIAADKIPKRQSYHSLSLYGAKVETPPPYLEDYTIFLHL
jgi:hypothetical protein